MTTPVFSLEQMAAVYKVEQDWLFEKLLGKLNAHRHLILAAGQGWGIQEYVSKLRFQLAENNPDIHICYSVSPIQGTGTMFLPIPSSGNGFEGAILQKGKHTDEQQMVGRILRKPARVSQ